MTSSWDLIKVEFFNVRSRILAFWGIYFTLGLLISLVWITSLPSQKNNVESHLKFDLIINALDCILGTPPYPLLFTLCATFIGPSIILLFIDIVPTEIATGQLLVMKTSGTELRRIYNIRFFLITLSFLFPHLLFWAIVHILTVLNLTNGTIIFSDALLLSLLQYSFISILILVFFAFCLILTFLYSAVSENQVTSSFLAIFSLLVPEIIQMFLDSQEINLSVSISTIFNNLFYSVPSSTYIVQLPSASNSYALLGLNGLLIIVISLFILFNKMIQHKEVY